MPLCVYLALLYLGLWRDRRAIFVRRVPWWMEDEALARSAWAQLVFIIARETYLGRVTLAAPDRLECMTRLQSTHLLLTKLLLSLFILLLFLDQRQCTPETQLIANHRFISGQFAIT